MRQFLASMVPRLVSRSKAMIQQSPGILSYALIIMATGFASCLIVEGYVAHVHPSVAVLSSLLSGFAPFIGLSVLVIIVALLISFVICTLEQTLSEEDDGIVPEPHLKSKWHHVVHCLPDQIADRLSLKEHSPPAFLFS